MALGIAAGLTAAEPVLQPGKLLFTDDFRSSLAQWVIEQQPGGTVTVGAGRLVISDQGGCTVWFRPRLSAPVVISYTVKMSSAARVSDMNCFWMASDPAQPNNLFATGYARDGRFATYDSLRTYYVGYGGNANTTTRFRRYDGTGARPLRPEHNLTAAEFLLQPNHEYHITLIATADGHVQYVRDGVVLFDVLDPEPLTRGWFGFRTINSRMEISDFRVSEPAK